MSYLMGRIHQLRNTSKLLHFLKVKYLKVIMERLLAPPFSLMRALPGKSLSNESSISSIIGMTRLWAVSFQYLGLMVTGGLQIWSEKVRG